MKNELITNLKKSLEDDYFSKSEKNSLKAVLGNHPLDQDTLNFLRTKIYDLANEKVTAANFQLVMQWIKDANNLLAIQAAQQSRAFFSPGEACRNAIIQQINLSLRQLKICVFTISDDPLFRRTRKGLLSASSPTMINRWTRVRMLSC